MSCKQLKVERTSVRQMVSEDIEFDKYYCKLKLKSGKKKQEVYDQLHKLGYQGSLLTYDCPFAEIEKFNECPFF